MTILVPSILTKDPEEVHEKLRFLESIPELSVVQIDFADGKFVPNELCYPKDIGRLETRLEIEAHLMVRNPQAYFHDLEAMGAKTVFIHYESFHSNHELETALANARHTRLRRGLAINPQTEVGIFSNFINQIEETLIMGVNPGFQGAAFIPETLERCASLRVMYPDAIIEVDGGVKLNNIETLVAAGASKVNVGSGIWQTPDHKKTIRELLNKLK